MGPMNILASTSFTSDTVSTQETGISVHPSQCISTRYAFGHHTKSEASKLPASLWAKQALGFHTAEKSPLH